jgi:hypothetical protein
VTAAGRGEIVANVFLGERLRAEQAGVYGELGVTVTREHRPTKEYPAGQEVYALTFDGTDPDATPPEPADPGASAEPSDPSTDVEGADRSA